jgi:hypothetical protein
LQAANLGRGRIVAAVIDIDDLVIQTPVEGGADLGHERCDIAGLVLDRNDNGNIHATKRLAPDPSRSSSPFDRSGSYT